MCQCWDSVGAVDARLAAALQGVQANPRVHSKESLQSRRLPIGTNWYQLVPTGTNRHQTARDEHRLVVVAKLRHFFPKNGKFGTSPIQLAQNCDNPNRSNPPTKRLKKSPDNLVTISSICIMCCDTCSSLRIETGRNLAEEEIAPTSRLTVDETTGNFNVTVVDTWPLSR